jgi:hypothetical protein
MTAMVEFPFLVLSFIVAFMCVNPRPIQNLIYDLLAHLLARLLRFCYSQLLKTNISITAEPERFASGKDFCYGKR